MEFLKPGFNDILDILIVAFVIYRLILILKKTGGYQIFLSLGLILIMYFVASVLNLGMMRSFLRVLKDYWVIAFIVLFHPEIRSLFNRLVEDYNLTSLLKTKEKSLYSKLLNAISIMSFRKIGAIIVIENNRKLDDFIESGEYIDSKISIKLLLTVFNNKTILHDGAAIIRNNRILAVKVVLPLSENVEYTQRYGTRHLAAIGITEKTDALSIIVSEENGKISFAQEGNITYDLTIDELSQKIKDETK